MVLLIDPTTCPALSLSITLLPRVQIFLVQFSSVAQSCPTLFNPMDCSTPGFPDRHQLLELAQLMSIESVMPSNHLILCHPFSSRPQSFPASGSFPMSQLFTSGGTEKIIKPCSNVIWGDFFSPYLIILTSFFVVKFLTHASVFKSIGIQVRSNKY